MDPAAASREARTREVLTEDDLRHFGRQRSPSHDRHLSQEGFVRGAAVQSRPVLPFLDLDLLLLARYLQRFRQMDTQHAIVELGLDLRRVGIER
jgi:hypothetical protein